MINLKIVLFSTLLGCALIASARNVSPKDSLIANNTTQITPDDNKISADCKFKGLKLYGKIKYVTAFPDIKIQVVDAFPDIKIKMVQAFPDECGKWQIVEAFPDLKVQLVNAFPDIKVKFVEVFPGIK